MIVRSRRSSRRRASGAAAAALAGALALVPGCHAYNGRFMSFPFNSSQMVENAASYDWTFGQALGAEFAFQLFPLGWAWTAIDLICLPLTLGYDTYVLVAVRESDPFKAQVEREKRKGFSPRPVSPADASRVVPQLHDPKTSTLDPTDR